MGRRANSSSLNQRPPSASWHFPSPLFSPRLFCPVRGMCEIRRGVCRTGFSEHTVRLCLVSGCRGLLAPQAALWGGVPAGWF